MTEEQRGGDEAGAEEDGRVEGAVEPVGGHEKRHPEQQERVNPVPERQALPLKGVAGRSGKSAPAMPGSTKTVPATLSTTLKAGFN